MSAGRVAIVGLAAGAGYVAGFYGGFLLFLTVAGLDELGGSRFELVTVPPGVLLAGLAASLAAPDTGRILGRMVAVAAVTALILLAVLSGLDGDFGVDILLGGAITIAAITGAAAAFTTG